MVHALNDEARAIIAALIPACRLLRSVRSRWFPSKSFKEVEAWTDRALAGFPEDSRGLDPSDLVVVQTVPAYLKSNKEFSAWFLAYCIAFECAAAARRGDISEAIDLLAVASLISAFVFAGGSDAHAILSAAGRKAVNIRHAKNRERKAKIQAWYIENRSKFRSMEQAAQAAAKIHSVTPRTAREHIGEASKNLRSTRRP